MRNVFLIQEQINKYIKYVKEDIFMWSYLPLHQHNEAL